MFPIKPGITFRCGIIACIAVALFSCKSSDPGPQSDLDSLLVVVVPPFDAASKYNGKLLSLKLTSGNIASVADIKGVPVSVKQSGDAVFVLAKDNFFLNYHLLNRIDLRADTLEAKIYSKLELYEEPLNMVFHNSKLYIPCNSSNVNSEIISIVNTETLLAEDTLHVSGDYITDLLFVNGRLFIKEMNRVKVYNASTFAQIGTLALQTENWQGMMLDKNNKILIPTGTIQSINPDDLSVITTVAKADSSYYLLVGRPALDRQENVLYFFSKSENAFMSLKKVNLATGEVGTVCSDYDYFFPSHPLFVRYDATRKMIILGSGDELGKIVTVTPGGQLIKEYKLLVTPLDVVLEE